VSQIYSEDVARGHAADDDGITEPRGVWQRDDGQLVAQVNALIRIVIDARDEFGTPISTGGERCDAAAALRAVCSRLERVGAVLGVAAFK
jgi:hypothetical protein